jgi:unsaturated chondroitin disaccharide hydrolase
MKRTVFLIIVSVFTFHCHMQKTQNLVSIVHASLDLAARQYVALDQALPDSLFPRTLNTDGSLRTNASWWWTSGFFPGSLWYLYEFSRDPSIEERAAARTGTLEREKWNNTDHDIGFKIFCSFGNGYRLTQNPEYRSVILTAAKTLTTRFNPGVGCIQSWGENQDRGWRFPVIIDNMMNLELLFWAAKESGDSSFYQIAVSHADCTLANHFRPDGSSYHVISYNPETGEIEKRNTAQGYSDDSAWARGQAWGLYGFVVSYRKTGYARYLKQCIRIADFILNHPNMPEDKIPYWDFNEPDIPDAPRDASAAAIIASALIELSDYVDPESGKYYFRTGQKIIRSLSGPHYRSKFGQNGHFLLKHGVGHLPADSEVDVPLSYADYYYIEAMLRFLKKMENQSQ